MQTALLKVAPHAELLEPLFAQGAKGLLASPTSLNQLAKAARVSTSKLGRLRTALEAARDAGLVVSSNLSMWKLAIPACDCNELGLMLKGVVLYRTKVHEDADRVSVVISKPPEPSAFSNALSQSLRGDWGMLLTADALEQLAVTAKTSFVVMTPYTDGSGVARVIALFEAAAPSVQKTLIVRDASTREMVTARCKLTDLSVAVYEFRLARDTGQNETFHAKVVCSDESRCYVGSSNMNNWSFNYSLELGFLVEGAAARRTAEIVKAVLAISSQRW